jgi:hypothetical protein
MTLRLVRECWRDARTGQEGERWIQMDVNTPEEQAAIDQANAAQEAADTSNRTTLESRAGDALAANDAFLALASYTQADVLAQVKALTRQQNAIIRLTLKRYSGGAGATSAPAGK